MADQPTRMTGKWTELVTVMDDTNKVWTNDAKHKFSVRRANGQVEKIGIKKDVLGWEVFTSLQAGQQISVEVQTGIYTRPSDGQQFPFGNIEHWAPFTGNLQIPQEAYQTPAPQQQAPQQPAYQQVQQGPPPSFNPNGTLAPPAPSVDMVELARTILFAGFAAAGNDLDESLRLTGEAQAKLKPTLESLTAQAAQTLGATPEDDPDDDIPF